MDVETDTTGSLADHCTLLERVVDTLNAVVLHANEEAGAELRVRRAGVEERRGSMSEITFAREMYLALVIRLWPCKEDGPQEVVGLDYALDVSSVNTDGNTHEHVLRPFSDAAIDAEQVRPLERLEAEAEITISKQPRYEVAQRGRTIGSGSRGRR